MSEWKEIAKEYGEEIERMAEEISSLRSECARLRTYADEMALKYCELRDSKNAQLATVEKELAPLRECYGPAGMKAVSKLIEERDDAIKEQSEIEIAHGKTAIKLQAARATNARLRAALEKGCRCSYGAGHLGPCEIRESSPDAAADLAAIRDAMGALKHAGIVLGLAEPDSVPKVRDALDKLKERFGE